MLNTENNKKERTLNQEVLEKRLMIAYLLGYEKFELLSATKKEYYKNENQKYRVQCSVTSKDSIPAREFPCFEISNYDSDIASNMSTGLMAFQIHNKLHRVEEKNEYAELKEILASAFEKKAGDEEIVSEFLNSLLSKEYISKINYKEKLVSSKNEVVPFLSLKNQIVIDNLVKSFNKENVKQNSI